MVGNPSRALAWALIFLLMPGCATLWDGDWEEDGHRRIYLYEVQPGDTLGRIAWRHGLRVEQLQRWNELANPDEIQAGAYLVLNPPGDEGAAGGHAADTAPGQTEDTTREPPPPPDDAPDYELGWVWPADGVVRRSYATDSGGKSGIQIGGSEGDTVRAAADGEVVYSGSGLRGYGNLVIVMHDDRFLSAYGYNRALNVAEGERVSGGDPIAEMGRAPGADEASLHFEIRIDGEVVDPEDYLPARDL
ncbi:MULTISPECIES: peptidoglycan DD-metalloendopeptidase family protein [unclassified Halorhodospira]|uniref:peptidoglycan DD-metalloendopeptidase family protein n=1 Tax=unclassified Halorhodospira TaxID=2626748 RepID=UPI001EE8A18A|nr:MULTISPECIES: peptidoglycan DD-metalloendopeptidase family protein [unclassified Halorhodospira]MCG5540505.1 peptidoglycan DD-metalloendopeptidase family protein [Halorhodospira sp. M39old]MCG5544999.1 peptidoglycan DD-metalloendopeptidase family protein [Halorhodospira sp. M38]